MIPIEYEKRFGKTSYNTLKKEYMRVSGQDSISITTVDQTVNSMATNMNCASSTSRESDFQSRETQVMPSISTMSISSNTSAASVSKKAGRPKEVFNEAQQNMIRFLFQMVKDNVTQNIPEQYEKHFASKKSYNTLKVEYKRLMEQRQVENTNQTLPTTSAAANVDSMDRSESMISITRITRDTNLRRELSDLSYESHLPEAKKIRGEAENRASETGRYQNTSRYLFQQEPEQNQTFDPEESFQDESYIDEPQNNPEVDTTFLLDNDTEQNPEEIDNENEQLRIDPDDGLVVTHNIFRNAELNNITYHNIGNNTYVCRFCNASNFFAERNTRLKSYSICCANGKVTLPELRVDEVIKSYFLPNNQRSNLRKIEIFKRYIRIFNNLLAFASLNVESVRPNPPTGVYAYKIHGQMYHRISTLHPNPNQQHRYAQLYIIDSELALQERMNMIQPHPDDQEVFQEILDSLGRHLAQINPYARQYTSMQERERDYNPDTFRMYLSRQLTTFQHPRRFNLPACGEVAAIFTDQDGRPPTNLEIVIFPRMPNGRDGIYMRLPYFSPHSDPMSFPILFPYGEAGKHHKLLILS
jgi:hypothetical protein